LDWSEEFLIFAGPRALEFGSATLQRQAVTTFAASCRYRFGLFELQPDERRLLASGAPVHLGANAFDVLVVLVERAGHLVSKDELLRRVWPKVVVEENTLHVHISALRKVLGTGAVATVFGRGYRFVLEVTQFGAAATALAAAPKHNLPHDLTSFIGRESELAELSQLLRSARLLTLTAAGGCGKSRLAIELARQQAQVFPDGTWLVELAALTDAAMLPQTVATVLGIKEKMGAKLVDTIAEYLASRGPLLVLDNAEHLLEACAQFTASLLSRCGRLVILVTSRERLRITGEQTYRVPSLSMPDEESDTTPESIAAYESARLFIDRARLQLPHFAITPQNCAAIASVCRRLDGIALALELAASRVQNLSVEELSRQLDLRFELLTEGSRTALPRHRTLRALIDWSYDLLSHAESAMLRSVSVFAGGWTLEAAVQVWARNGAEANDVVILLASLTDKNLVVSNEHSGTARYQLLETIRQYSVDRLRETGEEAQSRNRHLAYFRALAYDGSRGALGGPDQRVWLDRQDAEHDNFRAALTWSVAANAEDGLYLAAALVRFWGFRSHFAEARVWLTRLLDAVPGSSRTIHRTIALNGAGFMAICQRDYAAAEQFYEKGVELAREINDSDNVAYALDGLGHVALEQGRYDDAERFLRESVALSRAIGRRELVAMDLLHLGKVMRARGDRRAMLALFNESLAVAREVGHRPCLAAILCAQSRDALAQGDLDTAEAGLIEMVAILEGLGDRRQMADAMEGFALLALAKDAPHRAARIWGATERLRDEIGSPIQLHDQADHNRAVETARAVLGAEAFVQSWREGLEMSSEDAVRYTFNDQDMGCGG
jgi:predicted ATPase/DNA-binding winged helix-turn-helix (wHTH) protein